MSQDDSNSIGVPVLVLALALTGPARAEDPASPTRDAATPSAATEQTVLYTNRDLPCLPSAGTATAGSVPQEAAAPALPPLTYATYTDTKGRDERWWRNTVKQHQVATAEADEELERAYRLFKLSVLPLHDSRRVVVTTRDVVEIRELYRDAQARVDLLTAQWNSLMDEARTTAALPGWFR